MGNTNSHVSERRKSTGGVLMQNAASVTGSSPPASDVHRNPNSTTSGVGPVDITKPSNVGKSPNRLLSGTGSAISRTVRGLRPRSGGDGSSSHPRTRANTISSSQRPHWSRQLFSGWSEDASSTRENAPGGSGGVNAQESNPVPSNLPAAIVADGASAAATDKRLPTIFKYPGPAKEVYICGSFNNWQKLKMSQSTKDFVAIVELKEGEHEYRFCVDGEWKTDPNQPAEAEATAVTTSMIRVQKEDFNAYHALDMDSKAVAMAQQNQKQQSLQVADTYGQEIPPVGSRTGGGRSGPPILPPHLLQVVLNKDTPLSCEPTLLPLPKHVMLNHLYALSIKDGVMVLSATQRYKKKFVTTLLYKPMGERKT